MVAPAYGFAVLAETKTLLREDPTVLLYYNLRMKNHHYSLGRIVVLEQRSTSPLAKRDVVLSIWGAHKTFVRRYASALTTGTITPSVGTCIVHDCAGVTPVCPCMGCVYPDSATIRRRVTCTEQQVRHPPSRLAHCCYYLLVVGT